MNSPAANSRCRRCGGDGFSLVELLAVIAILSLLAAIVIPTTTGARNAAKRARTKVEFTAWASALERFRQEYGYYPILDAGDKVNAGAAASLSDEHRFHDLLAARRRDGSALPASSVETSSVAPERQNARGIRFMDFPAGEIFGDDAPQEDWRGLIHDAFDNPDIAVLVDRNLDGRLDQNDYPQLPAVVPPDDPECHLIPVLPETGIRAAVAFYSAPPRAREASELIRSWP